MLKKIIAAAAASTLAVSALAATASAASTEVVYEGYDVVDYVTVTLKGEVKDVDTALRFTNAHPKTAELGDAEIENYSSLEMILKNNTGKDVKITSGKFNSEFTANTQDWDISKGEWGSKKETTKKGEVAVEATTVKKNGKDTKATLKTDSFGDMTKYSRIESWVSDKTKITAELTLELSEDQFKSLYAGGLDGIKISDSLNDAISDNVAVATSPLALRAKNKGADGNEQTNDLNMTWKISDAKVTTKKVIKWQYTYRVDDESSAWSRNDMRKMVNGGTVEFVFNNPVSGKDWVDGVIMFRNSNGQNTTVEADYTEATNSLKVDIPRNFFYSDNTNEYSLTSVTWGIQRKGFSPDGGLDQELRGDAAPSDDMKNLKITKVIFTANDKAPDNGNSGGLVEDDKNKPSTDDKNSSDTKPSTPDSTNSGSTSNDNKNPSTGVAMAVAPVALAAAAAAVVISKKRK